MPTDLTDLAEIERLAKRAQQEHRANFRLSFEDEGRLAAAALKLVTAVRKLAEEVDASNYLIATGSVVVEGNAQIGPPSHDIIARQGLTDTEAHDAD